MITLASVQARSFIPVRPAEGIERSGIDRLMVEEASASSRYDPLRVLKEDKINHNANSQREASSRYDPLRVLKGCVLSRQPLCVSPASSRYDPLRVLKERLPPVRLPGYQASSRYDPLRVLKGKSWPRRRKAPCGFIPVRPAEGIESLVALALLLDRQRLHPGTTR